MILAWASPFNKLSYLNFYTFEVVSRYPQLQVDGKYSYFV